jgi:hypothetical protein
MKAAFKFLQHNIIRLYFLYSLIFFAIIPSCTQREKSAASISLVWDNNQAKALAIPKKLADENIDSLKTWLRVSVENGNSVAMLGDYSLVDDNVLFTPLVPFTRGLGYDVYFRNKLIGKIKVPAADSADAPVVLNIFPSQDTLPENLLKIYLQFSSPMREGDSKKYLTLVDEKNDTMQFVFLDLQPELWSQEGTILTVWLDPGRIKRDLIPNRKLGNPLQNGKSYTVMISDQWQDTKGLKLKQSFSKRFFTTTRDSISPDPASWGLNTVTANTTQPLEINFKEPLDYFLLQETIGIADKNNIEVPGEIRILDKEKGIRFIPANKWKPGKYVIQVQPVLEDLAGNNLNRPFDRDLSVKKINEDKIIFIKPFEIK